MLSLLALFPYFMKHLSPSSTLVQFKWAINLSFTVISCELHICFCSELLKVSCFLNASCIYLLLFIKYNNIESYFQY